MPEPTGLKYFVYAPPFDENVGGIIFLHQLVHELNEQGAQAYLVPFERTDHHGRLSGLVFGLKRRLFGRKTSSFEVNPDLNTPVASVDHLFDSSIVVYPEIVLGNPLSAKNVVRWLLYEPGLRNPYDFGQDEMFFSVGEMSDLPQITGGAPELFLWKVNRVYRNENRPGRDGVCYIVRKGDHKPRIPETEVFGAIQIDNKSHAEINAIFNRCHTFYSYDEATMYSQYAAVCGCTSIVIPELYETRDEWVKSHNLARYGVAYGVHDTGHAIATQDKVLGLLEDKEAKGRATVKQFIELTGLRFNSISSGQN